MAVIALGRPDDEVGRLISLALDEDVGPGDRTAEAVVPAQARGIALIVAKEPLVVSGISAAARVFRALDPSCEFGWRIYRRRRDAVDPLDRPVPRGDGDARGVPPSIGFNERDRKRTPFVAAGAEDGDAVLAHMHRFAGDGQFAALRELHDHQTAL